MQDRSGFLGATEGANRTCPSCDGQNVTTTLEVQRFTYGADEDAVELKARVDVHHSTTFERWPIRARWLM